MGEAGETGTGEGTEDPSQVGKANPIQVQELAVVGAGVIDSEAAFAQAVWDGIEQARQQSLREITLCDPHFAF
jgi:hypothetical protein